MLQVDYKNSVSMRVVDLGLRILTCHVWREASEAASNVMKRHLNYDRERGVRGKIKWLQSL